MRAVAQLQLWDFEGADLEPALASLTGQVGFEALSIGLVQPAVHALRRQVTDGPRVLHYPAGFHFQPDARLYAGSRVKPTAAKWLRQRNPLDRLVRACTDQNLAVHARIDLRDLSDVIDRAPLAGTVNVFGEPHGDRLCPSNPDARGFLESVITDLSNNYALARIELTGLGFADQLSTRNMQSGRLDCNEIELYLLALCFCPSCRERAANEGVEPDRVAQVVTAALEAQFRLEAPRDLTVAEFLQRSPDIAAFEETRRQTTLTQLAGLRQRTKLPLAWRPESSVRPAITTSFLELFDAVILNDDHSERASDANIGAWTREWREPVNVEVELYPSPPHCTDAQSLVRRVMALSADGHTTLHFGPMGESPPPCLEWIRQAIRYAKRENA